MNRKLHAFTLFELVIGMLLSAVVIGMVYSGYNIIAKMYDSHITRSREQAALMVLGETLQRDFDKAVTVLAQGQQIRLFDSIGPPAIIYQIQQNQLIRKSAVLDTFKLKQLKISIRFEGAVIQTGLTDALELAYQFSGTSITLQINKTYSAEQLFNQTLWNQ